MKFLDLQRELKKSGLIIFTTNDVVKITEQNKSTVNTFLQRQAKQKNIFRLKKGHYSLKKLDNKFLLAKAFNDSYLGLHSAMEFYGTTTQRYNVLELISKNNLKNLEFKEFGISFHKVNKKLFFGYKKEKIEGVEIFVSDIEKTLIDCIYFSDKVYLSEILEFIKKTSLDKNKLELYLNRINSSALSKRAGYLLEKCGITINDLKFNNKYEKLNKNLNNKGEKNIKWKLIINEEL